MIESENRLTLKVAGKIYGGWKSARIQTAIDQLAGVYTLEITERWPEQPRAWGIPPGETCALLIGDTPVISGYVDQLGVSYDAGSHTLTVTGRDKAGDLIDCSAPSTSFTGLTFLDIAKSLCAPYGIAVIDTTGAAAKQPVAKFAVQTGASVFETLEKAARREAFLLISDGAGCLMISRAATTREFPSPGGVARSAGVVALEFGKNILAASADINHTGLYSEITVKGQCAAPLSEKYEVIMTEASGKVERPAASQNSRIGRRRPLIVVCESQADSENCQKRAEWEAAHREADARKISVTVQGWRQRPGGALWKINTVTRLKCPWLKIDKNLLIRAVEFTLDERGTVTRLTLCDPRAFDPMPEMPAHDTGDNEQFRL